MLLDFMLLWVNRPSIMTPLLEGRWALGGPGQSGDSVGLGSSGGCGGCQTAVAMAGPRAVENPAPCPPPSPRRHRAARDAAGPCPGACPSLSPWQRRSRAWGGRGREKAAASPGEAHGAAPVAADQNSFALTAGVSVLHGGWFRLPSSLCVALGFPRLPGPCHTGAILPGGWPGMASLWPPSARHVSLTQLQGSELVFKLLVQLGQL